MGWNYHELIGGSTFLRKKATLKVNFTDNVGQEGNISNLIPIERIEKAILFIRGHKVMLDSTLAALYEVTTKRLNEQVRRNFKRFPPDFMFQLTQNEHDSLRSHFATLETGRGQHRKYLPLAFTEQGIAMLSSVLTSQRAIDVNIGIMRTFVRLRRLLASNKVLSKRLDELEQKYKHHDHQFKIVFDAIRKLITAPLSSTKKIGFRPRPIQKNP